MTILSLIIPFYNSEKKSERLLSRLSDSEFFDVEIILVDDGSTDRTRNMLDDFAISSATRTKIMLQDNKGPGGARNTGLAQAEGTYVWFIDSDDDVMIDTAVNIIRDVCIYKFDIIDFNLTHRGDIVNSMELEPGTFQGRQAAYRLLYKFGRLCTKLFRRDFLMDNKISYPEYCIYEDNPLQFIIPFFVGSLLKRDEVVYIHHTEFESITRGPRTARYYDRIWTANFGHKFAIECLKPSSNELRRIIDEHYVRLYLKNTGVLTRFPSRAWIEKARVMKKFRADNRKVTLTAKWPEFESKKQTLRFWLIWKMSLFFPSQEKYFESMRQCAWGRPFSGPELPMPEELI